MSHLTDKDKINLSKFMAIALKRLAEKESKDAREAIKSR